MTADAGTVTRHLQRFRDGDHAAGKHLMDLLYTELHRRARSFMAGERQSHTLQPTALVHEAYLQLVEEPCRDWQNRSHFLAAAAIAMRRILIDHARARLAEKRGGGVVFVELDANSGDTVQNPEQLLALNAALDKLAALDPESARLVELKYFGGLTEDELAAIFEVGVRTVNRRWRTARAWLRAELGPLQKG
jgi:RNA polymerase sigma-70 factor (ECF subfamily)